ncbi:MAG: arsenate reductase family protein [Candidatus Limnocylindrales bacterium]
MPPRHPVATDAPAVQLFGLESDQATRAALRFFKERRVPVSFVDLRRRPIAPAELRRFVARLGAIACADTDGRAWKDAGLGYLRMTDHELAVRLLADVRLLRLPLVRRAADVSVGRAEATWNGWLGASGPARPVSS